MTHELTRSSHEGSHKGSHEDSREPLAPHAASRRVLIVEDEKRLREMLCASVAEMGLSPTAANSGESAMKLVQQHLFAVALVDLNLPGMTGLEFCERLTHMKLHVQTIILTGFGDLEAARQAIRLEVVDFLTKPCGMDELENSLNRARLRWLDRWAMGDRPAQTLREFEEPPTVLTPLPAPVTNPGEQVSIDEMERQLILTALARNAGNRQAAAAELGISVRKLYYRIQQYQPKG
jgi:DNA-binding NtrC family response regulator